MQKVTASIEFLTRCGLLHIPDDLAYIERTIYDVVRENPQFIKICNDIKQRGHFVDEKLGVIQKTEFGRNFYEVCIQ